MTTPKTPTDRLADGFVASSLPPIAPDGGLQLEAAATGPLMEKPISLCQLGPCRHYHELTSELEAQQPLDGSSIHLPVIVTRACYPSPGSEIELSGETSIMECNRWAPMNKTELAELSHRRKTFKENKEGEWDAYVESWKGVRVDAG
jgi:hypothetical protein